MEDIIFPSIFKLFLSLSNSTAKESFYEELIFQIINILRMLMIN